MAVGGGVSLLVGKVGPFWDLFGVLGHDRVVLLVLVGRNHKLADLDFGIAEPTVGDTSVPNPKIKSAGYRVDKDRDGSSSTTTTLT